MMGILFTENFYYLIAVPLMKVCRADIAQSPLSDSFFTTLPKTPLLLVSTSQFIDTHPAVTVLLALLFAGVIITLAVSTWAIMHNRSASLSLRNIFENLPDAVIVHDRFGKVLFCNTACCKMLKKENTACCPPTIFDIEEQDFNKSFRQRLDEILKNSKGSFQGRWVMEDSGFLDVEINASLCEWKNKQAITLIARDISERQKQLKTALQFTSIVESTKDAILSKDLQGNIMTFNKAAEDIYGYSADEIIGKNVKILMPENKKTDFDYIMSKVKQGIPVENYQTIRKTKDGRLIELELSVSPLKDKSDHDRIIGISTIARDVSEQNEARIRLHEAKNQYQQLVENLSEGVWQIDNDGYTVFVNKSMADMLGYEKEEMICRHLFDFMHPESIDEAKSNMQRRRQGISERHEFVFIKKDGSDITTELATSPVFDDNDVYIGAIACVTDITQRTLLQEQRETLLRELSLKSKDMEKIIYISSHDLRSPLVNIQGFTSELAIGYKTIVECLKKVEMPDEQKHQIQEVLLSEIPTALRYITSSVRKMDLLLNGLLKLSRIGRQELKPKKLDTNSMMKEIIRTLQFKVNESKADIIIEDLPNCYADPFQINQVFTNIIDNAVKYLDPDRPGKIKISGSAVDGEAKISITDNGIGMDPKYADQIFDLFHRLNPESPVQGDGLGLSIVSTIIERHHGRITFDSKPDQGTTFTITLPAHHN